MRENELNQLTVLMSFNHKFMLLSEIQPIVRLYRYNQTRKAEEM